MLLRLITVYCLHSKEEVKNQENEIANRTEQNVIDNYTFRPHTDGVSVKHLHNMHNIDILHEMQCTIKYFIQITK